MNHLGDFLFINYFGLMFPIFLIRLTYFAKRNELNEYWDSGPTGQPKFDAAYHELWFYRTLLMIPFGGLLMVPMLLREGLQYVWPKAFPPKPVETKKAHPHWDEPLEKV